jgi:hypothetical protein
MLRSNDMVRLRLQDSGDGRHLPSPFPCFGVEPLSSLVCQDVILCAPAIRGLSIRCSRRKAANREPAFWRKTPLLVPGFERQCFQNEHVQSALNQIHSAGPPWTHSSTENQEEEYTSPPDCQEENHEMSRKPRVHAETFYKP